MTTTVRPRRSVLYMPGSNVRALDKARSLPADGLILDLEDAVSPESKEIARQQVVEAVAQGGYGGREILIRTNALSTEWGEADLDAAARSGADAVLIPKVDDADMVHAALDVLDRSGAPQGLKLWCMMETAKGMLHAEAIAAASPRLGGFIMGTSDLAKELNCEHTPLRLPMITSLGLCLLAAKAYGLAILDGVYLDLSDLEGLLASCVQGREMGFDGKTLIHPKQIDAANEAFAPTEDDIAWARRVVEAHKEAAAAGQGVVLLDGRLVENLHVAMAERTIALADAIAASRA